jgi:tRNA G10  N-methylase Trm11
LLRYSKKGDTILDQFAGGGTTLVEARLLGRDAVGVDVSHAALARCREKCGFDHTGCGKVTLWAGDARDLNFLPNGSIDLICTHPPYADAIRYSDLPNDLSRLKPEQFLEQMRAVASESLRVLSRGNHCAFMIGDVRHGGAIFPLGFKTMELFVAAGFELREIVIKQQNNCTETDYWIQRSIEQNFLLLSHEYLFVLRKRA